VFEKADRIGGLLMYGIPSFKLDKEYVQRRIKLLEEEGIKFVCNAHVGQNVKVSELKIEFDVILLAGGAEHGRDIGVPGRKLKGIHYAMEFLPQQNKRCLGDSIPDSEGITANGKHVVIIGGGDTGSDCIGTSHRQGALSVTSLELMPEPPSARAATNPWPQWSRIKRSSSSHEEGGQVLYASSTRSFIGQNGQVTAMVTICSLPFSAASRRDFKIMSTMPARGIFKMLSPLPMKIMPLVF
jgi:glutamate synthase (NADPH/NADH) small chain